MKILSGRDVTSLAVPCTLGQKLPASFSGLEDPENEVVATARNLKCKLLKTRLGKYGKPMVVIAINVERRGGNVLEL